MKYDALNNLSCSIFRWWQSGNTRRDPVHGLLSHAIVFIEANGPAATRNNDAHVFWWVFLSLPLSLFDLPPNFFCFSFPVDDRLRYIEYTSSSLSSTFTHKVVTCDKNELHRFNHSSATRYSRAPIKRNKRWKYISYTFLIVQMNSLSNILAALVFHVAQCEPMCRRSLYASSKNNTDSVYSYLIEFYLLVFISLIKFFVRLPQSFVSAVQTRNKR